MFYGLTRLLRMCVFYLSFDWQIRVRVGYLSPTKVMGMVEASSRYIVTHKEHHYYPFSRINQESLHLVIVPLFIRQPGANYHRLHQILFENLRLDTNLKRF
jgi:hypothetical protein